MIFPADGSMIRNRPRVRDDFPAPVRPTIPIWHQQNARSPTVGDFLPLSLKIRHFFLWLYWHILNTVKLILCRTDTSVTSHHKFVCNLSSSVFLHFLPNYYNIQKYYGCSGVNAQHPTPSAVALLNKCYANMNGCYMQPCNCRQRLSIDVLLLNIICC